MIGKFHPVLVHLPIGFFFLALVIRILIGLKKISVSESFFRWVLLSTLVVSLLSVGTGLLLAGSGEYEAATLDRHRWLALLFCALLFLLLLTRNRVQNILWVVSLGVLTLAGHYGGTLTHGADFLQITAQEERVITDVQEAVVYEEVIRPILEKKCYSCHGNDKQKGKLRLDSPEFLLKGGEDGPALEAFHPGKSLMMMRMLLPDSDEDHMPPKGKPQVTEEEKALIEWWIYSGADFRKKSRELPQEEKIQKILRGLETPVGEEQEALIPEKEVKPASPIDLEVLQKAGILVNPAGLNTNYLEVNLRGIPPGKAELKALESLKEQVIRLNAAGVPPVEELAEVIGKLENLRILHLQRTPWSDKEMAGLKGLSHLRVLNLSFTRVTDAGVKELEELKGLRRLYLYSSGVEDRAKAMKALPGVVIDTGGYRLNTLPADSLQGDF